MYGRTASEDYERLEEMADRYDREERMLPPSLRPPTPEGRHLFGPFRETEDGNFSVSDRD